MKPFLSVILILPLIVACLPFIIKGTRALGRANSLLHGAVLILSSILALTLSNGTNTVHMGIFFADALSGFFILTIAVVNFASALYAVRYTSDDVISGKISDEKSRKFYILFNFFAFTMLMVPSLNNMGFVWVAIEMTTLVSAFLVGFYNNKKSVEAAWKYLILCSIGITLALLGTILMYYTLSANAGIKSLNWTEMKSAALLLDKNILKVAFLFILIGYGTKAGLAPMHTWLPDAHSQAPAPISALLSGVLLKTSIYAIIRFMIIVNASLGASFCSSYLVGFGILSLAVASGFILVQKDMKRLLAYSSIEHVGIIVLGLGIGGKYGYFGALFHVFNHAVTKSLVFFGVGDIVKKYGTNNMRLIRGAGRALPGIGIMTFLGAFALAGTPPFSVFFSELMILIAAFTTGHYAAACAFLLFIALAFGGIVFHVSRSVFSRMPEGIVPYEPLACEKAAFVFLAIFIVFFGFAIPEGFANILRAASGVLH